MSAHANVLVARRERGESLVARWGRRALTIPLYVGLAGAVLALVPLLLLPALASDLVRRVPLVGVRCVLVFALYLSCEALGLVAAFGLWVAAAVAPARFLDWNFALQRVWARTLFAGAARVFGLRIEVGGDAAVGRGPLLVFVRHASVADTLLPAVFLAGRHRIRLRWVMKRDLLWDPCLDVVGQRLQNVFVRRGSADGAREVARVARLAEDIGPGEGVLIYPEGTRFTPAKRARALAGLRSDPARFARVATLRHVLPPQLGGPQALLEARPDADVLLVAHVGFDGVTTLTDLWNGALLGRTVRVCFRRLPCADIPRTREDRIRWLDDQWAWVDAWVGAQHAREGEGG
jgi:1-acyl-sn-glycerol-3-phosphate acyltransferase